MRHRRFWAGWFDRGSWPGEDLYYGLIERVVGRVVLTDPEAFAAHAFDNAHWLIAKDLPDSFNFNDWVVHNPCLVERVRRVGALTGPQRQVKIHQGVQMRTPWHV